MVNFLCGKCGQVLQAYESMAGSLVACPGCSAQSVVPSSRVSSWKTIPTTWAVAAVVVSSVLAFMLGSRMNLLVVSVPQPLAGMLQQSTAKKPPAPTYLVPRIVDRVTPEKGKVTSVRFSLICDTSRLKMPTKIIKGKLVFKDALGGEKATSYSEIHDPVMPGTDCRLSESESTIYGDQIDPDFTWITVVPVSEITVEYVVSSILYADGSREDF